MHFSVCTVAALGALLRLGHAAAIEARASPSCRIVSVPVYAQARNRVFPNPVNVSNPDSVLSAIDDATFASVSGTETLVARYCEPTVQNANKDTLQVLFHGITSNKDYWFGLEYPGYQPANYSWVDYAASQGYPTLAVDRLGNGNSSHPDPVLVTQGPFEVALYHGLVQKIKNGTTGASLPSYSKIVLVGHSYGSELMSNIAQRFPDDAEAMIFTGFSKSVDPSLPGVTLQAPEPAAVHDPARFAGLDPGYVTSSYYQGRINSFFGTRPNIDYSTVVSHIFYNLEDTVSIGQFISTYTGVEQAPEYKGRVLVLTGEEDQAFCGPGSPVLGKARCGDLLAQTHENFPNAAQYSWHAVPNTGHAINAHYSAHSAFVVAHEFLAGQTFAG